MISIDILNNKISSEDVIREIGLFLPIETIMFLNKSKYEEYQKFIWSGWNKGYERLLRRILRNDYDYLFFQKLKINYKKWIKLKNWRYNNIVFGSYLNYLRFLCDEYNSGKCKKILDSYKKKQGFNKNKYRNNRHVRVRWSN